MTDVYPPDLPPGCSIGMVDRSAEPVPKKKRRKGTSPTARTLAECRKRGWIAQNVEQFVRFPPPGHRLDLFGVIDIIAIAPILRGQPASWPKVIIGIQATASAAHHAHRRDKIVAEPRMIEWLATGAHLELWSWSKRGAAGKAKRWTPRIERFEVRDGKLFGIEGDASSDLPPELVPDAIAVARQRAPRIK